MTYIVTTNIIDTKDNDRLYETGEVYPRADLTVSDNRIKELLEKGVIALEGAEGETTSAEEAAPAVESEAEPDPSVKELKAKLDELGIKYGSRATKDELKALLEGAEGE
nr:MAG TPA: dimeris T4 recombination endonuclease VII [Caudoviricetes sp.]